MAASSSTKLFALIVSLLAEGHLSEGFSSTSPPGNGRFSSRIFSESIPQEVEPADKTEIASQFKILTCTSTSCAKKRELLGQDEYSTFSAFFCRAQNTPVAVEESPCLGSCKMSPCVGIAHDEYKGTVALEGMTQQEFSDRVFHEIVDENDADRVWDAVNNAIRVLGEEQSSS